MKLWKIMAIAALAAGPAHIALGQDIRIGALLETSGAIASLGQPTLEGAQLAIDQANAAGGIQGRKIVLINVNSESDNTKTVSGARRLLSQEKVSAVIGPVSSGSNFAVADVIERAKVPMIANGASRGIVLPPEKRRYTFIAPLTDEIVQTVMLRDMQARRITKVAMLHSDVAFGTNGRDTLNRLAARYGVQVVATETFGHADTDMTPQLTKLRGSPAQAIVIWATGPGLAIATRNHRALAIDTPLYLTHAANDFNYLRLAGEAANDILLPSSKLYVAGSLPSDDAQKAGLQSFVAAYTKKYGKPPATFSGNGYDSANLLLQAMRTAGSDPAALRAQLEKGERYVGVTAIYAYGPEDHFGAKAESVRMLTVRKGAFELAAAP